MNDKFTSNEATETPNVETHEKDEKPTAPRLKALITGELAVRSGVRAGAGSGPKLPRSSGE